MFMILLVLLVIVSILMIGLILLQKSEGSGLSGSSAASMFGGVLTGASAGNFLTKATSFLATLFFVLCAALAIMSSNSNVANQQSELRQELIQNDPTMVIEEEPTATVEDVAEIVGEPVTVTE